MHLKCKEKTLLLTSNFKFRNCFCRSKVPVNIFSQRVFVTEHVLEHVSRIYSSMLFVDTNFDRSNFLRSHSWLPPHFDHQANSSKQPEGTSFNCNF